MDGTSPEAAEHRAGDGEPRRMLVVAAMPIELKPFNRMLSLTKGSLAGTVVYRGTLGASRADGTPGPQAAPSSGPIEVLASVTGIGPEQARRTLRTLLAATTVLRVAMIGIAGALDPSLQIGDLVVPAEVWDADTAEVHRPHLAQAASAHGTIRTAAAIQTDPESLAPWLEKGVVALDMETAAVASVCEAHGVPWSAFRAISDRVQDGIVDGSTLDLTNADGSSNPWAALRLVATRPSMVRPLAKLARDTRRATEVAAAAGVRECRAYATS